MAWQHASKVIAATTDQVLLQLPRPESQTLMLFRLSGTWVGTIKGQLSTDGSTWSDGTVTNIVSGTQANPTANGDYAVDLGASAVAGRVIFSAFTSGSARVEVGKMLK